MAASSSVVVKWNKAQYDIVLPASATVAHLKAEVARQTRVLPAQQKYAGCPALGKATDSDQVFSLSGIKAGQKLMMIGTAEEEAAAFQSQDVVLAAEKDKERAQRVERRQAHREAVATELVTACEEGRQALIQAAIQRVMAYKAKVQHEVEEFGEPEDDPEATQQLDDLLHMCRAKLAELEAAERARLEAERRERDRVWAERELQARLGREQAQLERERAMEVDPEAKCDFTFACYSAGQVGGRPEVEVSDQVVLPAQALERVVALRIPMPLVLQASNPSSSSSSSSSPSPPSLPDATEMGGAAEEAAQPWQITHCGVFDFTAPEGMAFMPTGMMRKLRLSEGDCCRFRTHALPPGEYAQLQPLSDAWTRVPEKEACLEHALRKYQTLTVGDVIAITGPHDRNLYRFRCLQTRPSPAISVLNTDLTLDVTAPGVSPVLGEELGEEDWVRALAQQEAAGSDPTPAAVADLPLGSTVEGAVAAGCSQYYTLTVGPLGAGHPEGTIGLHVAVKRLAGDPDLYVSTRNRQPSRDDNEWARNEAVGDKTLFVPLPVPEQLFIAIHAYRVEARYSISTRAGERGIGQRLDTTEATEPMAETTLCPNCQRRVPTAAFVLHSAQCARRNVRCAQCGAVQEVGPAHEKHMYAVHSPVACRCGAQLEPEAMALHRQFECKYRLLPCVYCPLQISAEDRPQHLSDCGNRSVRCRLCPATFVRWRLKTHLGEAHQLDAEGPLTDYFEPV